MDPVDTEDKNYDEFESAFDDATTDSATVEKEAEGEAPAAEAKSADGAEEKDPEAEVEPKAADGTEAPAGDEAEPTPSAAELETGDPAEAEGAPAAPEEAPTSAPTYDEATLKRAVELLKEQDKAPAEAPAEAPTEEAVAKTWQDYVPENKREVVEKYEQEWAEVSEGEQIKRTAELQLLQDTLYSDLRSALAPVFETTQSLKVNAHLDAVRQQHTDLDEIRKPLQDWIETQPEFVRPVYKEVAAKGSAAQVIQLISQFKSSTGTAGAAPEVPAPSVRQPAPRPAKTQPTAAAKRALAAAPSPNRAEVPGSANPDDFDAAFDEAAGLG